MTHTCYFPGCGATVSTAVPTCATCSGRLPHAARMELLDAWLQLRWANLSLGDFHAIRERVTGPAAGRVKGGAA